MSAALRGGGRSGNVHVNVAGKSNFAPILHGGHILFRRGPQLVYDPTVVDTGTSDLGAADWKLSANGLHYAFSAGDMIDVDGVVFGGTNSPPAGLDCVANDGTMVLASMGDALYRVTRPGHVMLQPSVGMLTGNDDCQHYLAVVPNNGLHGVALVRDGVTVLPVGSGVDGQSRLFMSPSGDHWGAEGPGGATATWIDGRQVLPANQPTFWGQVTDLGHWTAFDQARSSVVVDGAFYRLTGGDHNIVAITPDASHRAVLVDGTGQVHIDGQPAHLPIHAQWIAFDGAALVAYHYT